MFTLPWSYKVLSVGLQKVAIFQSLQTLQTMDFVKTFPVVYNLYELSTCMLLIVESKI